MTLQKFLDIVKEQNIDTSLELCFYNESHDQIEPLEFSEVVEDEEDEGDKVILMFSGV